MRIGVISTAMPFVQGGGRFIVDWLHEKLAEQGYAVETVYIPFVDELDHILPQMAAIRLMNFQDYFDRVITIRPPAHMVRHTRKVVWFIHHLRGFYDLWDTPYRPVPDEPHGRALRDAIVAADGVGLGEAHRLFTNSRVVGDRIKGFNDLASDVLYPPILHPEWFRAGPYGDEVVSVCRMEHHKRQHLLIEAMAHTTTPVRLRLCGVSSSAAYVQSLRATALELNVGDRVTIEERWISEEEKVDRLESALASAYLPFNEDSYGYPTIEAAHARRCTLTVSDSGGVTEFVTDGETGFVADPEPQAVARALDRLFVDRASTQRMGEASQEHVAALGIDWTTVIGKLLS